MSDYKQTRSAAGDVTSQYGQMLRNLDDDLVKRLRGERVHLIEDIDIRLEAADRIEELETKLEKAVLFVEFLDENYRHVWGDTARTKVRRLYAELKAETDE